MRSDFGEVMFWSGFDNPFHVNRCALQKRISPKDTHSTNSCLDRLAVLDM